LVTVSVSGDLKVTYETFCNLTKKADGNSYLQPYDYEMHFDPKKLTLYFGNLFNGNKILGERYTIINFIELISRCQWPRGLRRRSAAAWLLVSRVRNPLEA
jgi:hypothetical protein